MRGFSTLSNTGDLESPGWVVRNDDGDTESVPPPPREDGIVLLDPTPLVTTLAYLLSNNETEDWLGYIDDTGLNWYLWRNAGEDDAPSIFMEVHEPLRKVDLPLSSIPIPAAAWLFGTALVGFIGVSRRRKVG